METEAVTTLILAVSSLPAVLREAFTASRNSLVNILHMRINRGPNQAVDLEAADQAEAPPAPEVEIHPRSPISLKKFAVAVAIVFALVQLSNVILGVIIKVAETT